MKQLKMTSLCWTPSDKMSNTGHEPTVATKRKQYDHEDRIMEIGRKRLKCSDKLTIWNYARGFKRQTIECVCCSEILDNQTGWQVYHLHAKTHGGGNQWFNATPGCKDNGCNQRMGGEHLLIYLFENCHSFKFDEMIERLRTVAEERSTRYYKWDKNMTRLIQYWHGTSTGEPGKIPMDHPLWTKIRNIDKERIETELLKGRLETERNEKRLALYK